MSSTIEVSIIIPSFNSVDTLPRALSSIEQIDYPLNNLEVIIVDDGSTDTTKEFIDQFSSKTSLNLVYIGQKNAGPAAARNSGIRQAKGLYLLIIDSDSFVDKGILSHYLAHFPRDGLGGVGGDVIPAKNNFISKYLDSCGVWRPGKNSAGEITHLVTANAFFLKEAIQKAGYFDEDFLLPGGEEPELCFRMRKIAYHFCYNRNAIVTHEHRSSFGGMIRMFFNHGKGAAIFVKKWPKDGKKKYFWDTVFAKNPINWTRNRIAQKAGFLTILGFFFLDYVRSWATYIGYRNMMTTFNNP